MPRHEPTDVSLSDQRVPISAVYAAMIDTPALDGWTDIEITQWCTELLHCAGEEDSADND